MPHRRFRIVTSIQNTNKIVVAGGTISTSPTYLEAYDKSGAPGIKSYRLIAKTSFTSSTILNQGVSIEPQYIEGYPTQPPYNT